MGPWSNSTFTDKEMIFGGLLVCSSDIHDVESKRP